MYVAMVIMLFSALAWPIRKLIRNAGRYASRYALSNQQFPEYGAVTPPRTLMQSARCT
jgi:hypothetical protein